MSAPVAEMPEKEPRQARQKSAENSRRQPAKNAEQGGDASVNNGKRNNRTKKEKPLVVNLGNEKRGKSDRRPPRQRGIPSAAKIVQYLDISVVGANVEDGIAHVLAQYPDLAAESTLVAQWQARREAAMAENTAAEHVQAALDAPETESAVQDEAALVTQIAENVRESVAVVVVDKSDAQEAVAEEVQAAVVLQAIEPEDEPESDARQVQAAFEAEPAPETAVAVSVEQAIAVAEAKGLMLVETDAAALAAFAAQADAPEKPALRRADVPKAQAALPPAEMIQVETQKA